jgi:hypothetical protein
MSPIRNYLIYRVHTYPITNEAKTKELNSIRDTLHNNEYNINLSISHSKIIKTTDPSSRQRGCYIRTLTVSVHLKKILVLDLKGLEADKN